ncbi:hypothetical protein CTI12_AA310550 [Artemisia annua]|uniref:RRM domain-containing protein n=1 Tax=Artemisia annua TaxID=35608 RepID=A0A2U1N420_ARTAN|nr:hypothetical protein CTI12_AA310550 [Artemisia annua]
MGSYRSKEDDVAKISTSIFVTNFPDSITAKDLFNSCKTYGHVVDSFIPTKRAKNGKRFGFVRFINVLDVDRFVGNLCTVWIDRHKLFANVARFQRNTTSGSFAKVKTTGGSRVNNIKSQTNVNVKDKCGGVDNSYVRAVIGEKVNGDVDKRLQPALVLDDECLISRDFSKSLLGRVKEFASLTNLKMTLNNEGFADVKIQYMGEFWVMLEFASNDSMTMFKTNVSIGSWFSDIKAAFMEFQLSKRIAWVEVEGIPFNLWSGNTFKRIANKWGELLDVDDQEDTCFHSKRLCIHTKTDRSISEDFKIIHRGKTYWVRAKETPGWVPDFSDVSDDEDQDDNSANEVDDNEQMAGIFRDASDDERISETLFQKNDQEDNNKVDGDVAQEADHSEDPFNIYPLLNKTENKDKHNNTSDDSLLYPPGFSPKVIYDENSLHDGNNSKCKEASIDKNKTSKKCEFSKNS